MAVFAGRAVVGSGGGLRRRGSTRAVGTGRRKRWWRWCVKRIAARMGLFIHERRVTL
jgi:hypothetical protein